ncbi:MAG: response regulator [Verrucomicrobia bacterium]|nr:response regulator [Verrucomicrobiota bacterium]
MSTRILVVDDDRPVRECVTQMLTANGCVVEGANGADEALAKFETESFDLVVTDYLMRGMNGRQLARVIKSFYPGVPVILLTGCFPSDALDQIDCVVLKPFSGQQLWTAIGEVFMRTFR